MITLRNTCTTLLFRHFSKSILINKVPLFTSRSIWSDVKFHGGALIQRILSHGRILRKYIHIHSFTHVTAHMQNAGTYGMRTSIHYLRWLFLGLTLALTRFARFHQIGQRIPASGSWRRWWTPTTAGYRYARNTIFGCTVAAPFVDECSTCVSLLNRHGDPFLFLLSFSSSSPIQSPVAGLWGTHGYDGSRAVVVNSMTCWLSNAKKWKIKANFCTNLTLFHFMNFD